MADRDGPKDLLEMLETQSARKPGVSGGFMMPAARPKAAGAAATAASGGGGFMMPAPVKRSASAKANAMAPPSSADKRAKTAAGADEGGVAGSVGGGGGEALPRAAGAGPLPHAPLISTHAVGGDADGEPYDPAKPNDYMAYCREV
jgi:hypothetical protein